MGYVYVIHASHENGSIEHYVGYTETTARTRFDLHVRGKGSAVTRRLIMAGFKLELVYWWQNCSLLDESFLIAQNKQDKVALWCKLCGNEMRYCPGMGKSTLSRVRTERHAARLYAKGNR